MSVINAPWWLINYRSRSFRQLFLGCITIIVLFLFLISARFSFLPFDAERLIASLIWMERCWFFWTCCLPANERVGVVAWSRIILIWRPFFFSNSFSVLSRFLPPPHIAPWATVMMNLMGGVFPKYTWAAELFVFLSVSDPAKFLVF